MPERSPIERALATGSFIRLRGKLYQCSPLKMRHFAEAKAFVIAMAPDPLTELIEGKESFDKFPPEIQKALSIRALELREERKSLSAAEASHWISSEEGVLFLFWCMVRDNHPEFATFQSLFDFFKPGSNKKEITIPECDLIRKKIDEVTLGGNAEAIKKKLKRTQQKKIMKKMKKKNH